MVKNFILISIRNLLKYKFYSFINIVGLAIGIACCLLITLFVIDELSYDRYHEKADRIYRLGFSGRLGGNDFMGAQVGAPVKQAMLDDFPEVESATRFRDRGSYLVRYELETFKEEKALFVDGNVFETFSFNLLKGNPGTALMEPFSLVMTRGLASKIFGEVEPLDKIVTLDNDREYKVTGIMEDIPANTHFTAEMLMSLESLEDSRNNEWFNMNFQTYVVMKPGTSPDVLVEKFPVMTEKYVGPQIQQYLGLSFSEFLEQDNRVGFFMDPITDIHLYSTLEGELGTPSDIRYVYIFSAIALFVLIIAGINFMNLSTARSANRAKEVGIRKVLGSKRKQLIGQFTVESIILTFISFLIALLFATVSLRSFNELANKSLSLPFSNPIFIVILLLSTLLIGFLAGSYPAFYLSAFNPATVLKGNLTKGLKSGKVRSVLVTFQFAMSIILIVGTLVIYNQLSYVQNKKLGFNKNQVLLINDVYALGDQLETFKNKMLEYSQVENATISGYLPVTSWRSSNGHFPGKAPSGDNIHVVQSWNVDHDYVETMELEIIEGRNFSRDYPSDSSAIIINETLAAQMGWEKPIGEIMGRFTEDPEVYEYYKVVGVLKDFHFESMREGIAPLLMRLGRSRGYLAMRIKTDNISELITQTENEWDKLADGQPFEYSFMDAKFDEMYQAEQQIGTIAIIFAVLAIFVACLGLFGLSAFTAEQRAKEIGIRKVMGASIPSIIYLLSKEFGKLILIAFIVAAPVAWYCMKEFFLADFTYKTQLQITTFLFAGGLVFVIAWFTMSFQSFKAATANPVVSLKNE